MSGADQTPIPGAPDPQEPNRPRPGVGADEALAGFPIVAPVGSRPLDRVRLAPVVAGALRAALDGLAGDLSLRAAMRVTGDDAVLEVRLERVDIEGLVVSGGVLETVEGNLVPAPHSPRQWIVRVPVLSPVESFLMIERDDLALALPWHAVSRVRMVRGGELAAIAAQEGSGVAEGFDAGPDRDDDVPAVLVALGLRRAWLAVDRLVWRLPASPDPEGPAPPRPGLGPALLTAEGERYWLVELSRLLRDVSFPPLPAFGGPPRPVVVTTLPVAEAASAPAPPPVAEPAAELAAAPPSAAEPAPAPPARPTLRLVTLTPADVMPFGNESFADLADVEPPAGAGILAQGIESPLPESEPAHGTAPAIAEAAPPLPERPRVLVAEDSITARMFLRRLLEQMGFSVHAVTNLRELQAALADEPWAIVMVDVELPDARGARVLTGLATRPGREPAPVVALVRDAEDAAIARSAGVSHTLRKPFERDDLERLLIALHRKAGDA